jgi:predicted nucleotidyltransferase component of viral defense system
MTSKSPSNIPASIKARLLNRARKDGVDFNLYLTRYATERLLYRLSQSPHASDFILKGAMLFVAWSDLMFRPTADLDLLGFGEDSIDRFERVFNDLATMTIDTPDGLTFEPDSVRAAPIRDEQEYQGKRVIMSARLGTIPIKLQIDIGIGDIITPGPETLLFPSLLDMPQTQLRASTRETVIAEKIHVMVVRGLLNSRLKDYFDIWVLQRTYPFDAKILRTALKATFERRRTSLPTELSIGLTDAYAKEPGRSPAWKRITRGTEAHGLVLIDAIREIAAFLDPVLTEPASITTWPPGGPWRTAQ